MTKPLTTKIIDNKEYVLYGLTSFHEAAQNLEQQCRTQGASTQHIMLTVLGHNDLFLHSVWVDTEWYRNPSPSGRS